MKKQAETEQENIPSVQTNQKNSKVFRNLYLTAKKIARNQKLNFTYADFSELIGIKKNTLACWIRGTRTPPDYVTELLSEKYADKLTDEVFLKEYLSKKQIIK